MKLLQIPFSHNCVKVRVVLDRKGIVYETVDVRPTDRSGVRLATGQGLVPALVDGERSVADSTAILLYVEERHPEPPMIPRETAARAECLLLEDWADRAFMALSRRIAYHEVLKVPGRLGRMFFPGASGLSLRLKESVGRRLVSKRFGLSPARYPRDVAEARAAAAVAVARLGRGPYLLGETFTIADAALAAMSAPLAADPEVASDDAVARLLSWGRPIVGPEMAAFYQGG